MGFEITPDRLPTYYASGAQTTVLRCPLNILVHLKINALFV